MPLLQLQKSPVRVERHKYDQKRCTLRRLLLLGAVRHLLTVKSSKVVRISHSCTSPSSLWGSDTPGWICSFEFFPVWLPASCELWRQFTIIYCDRVWSKRSSSCAQWALMKAAQFSHTECRTQSSCGGGRQTGYWFPVKSDGAACKLRHHSVRVQKRLTRLSTQLQFVKCCCCCLCMSLRWGGGDKGSGRGEGGEASWLR